MSSVVEPGDALDSKPEDLGEDRFRRLSVASLAIIEDLAVYCNQIFLSDHGGQDRLTAVENVKSNYQPNGTIN